MPVHLCPLFRFKILHDVMVDRKGDQRFTDKYQSHTFFIRNGRPTDILLVPVFLGTDIGPVLFGDAKLEPGDSASMWVVDATKLEKSVTPLT